MKNMYINIGGNSGSEIQGGSNMTGTVYTCLHTNQSRSYSNHLVLFARTCILYTYYSVPLVIMTELFW